jgi:hypothetical protein
MPLACPVSKKWWSGHGAGRATRGGRVRLEPPQEIRKLDGKFRAFPQLARAGRIFCHPLQLVELGQETFEAIGQKALPEIGVLARVHKIRVGNKRKIAHLSSSLRRLTGIFWTRLLAAGLGTVVFNRLGNKVFESFRPALGGHPGTAAA